MPENNELPVSTPNPPEAEGMTSQAGDTPAPAAASGKTNQTFIQKVKSLVGDFVEYAKNNEY